MVNRLNNHQAVMKSIKLKPLHQMVNKIKKNVINLFPKLKQKNLKSLQCIIQQRRKRISRNLNKKIKRSKMIIRV